MAHPDVASEQAYLDHAYDCLDRMREALTRAGESVVDDVAGEALDAWTSQFPLSPIWGILSASDVVRELTFCETALMQTLCSSERFRDRLRKRFAEVTAVAKALTHFDPATGGAYGHG